MAYLIWDTGYTLCDVPVFGLITTMADVQEERTALMTTGRIYANIGVIIAIICGYVLPTGIAGMSFSATAMLISFIMPRLLGRFDKYKLFMVGAVSDAALMAKCNNGEITKEECDQALSHQY